MTPVRRDQRGERRETMTTETALMRVKAIRDVQNDDERAHGLEDQLRADFIQAIAASDHPMADVARIVLTTAGIEFSRWCA